MANDGDILMLEAPPQASRPAEFIDALPYIDDDYGHPKVKEEVDRLVEDEMRRSSKKPSDFLKDLPPLPPFGFHVIFLLSSLEFALISRNKCVLGCKGKTVGESLGLWEFLVRFG